MDVSLKDFEQQDKRSPLLHERCIRIIDNEKQSIKQVLLDKNRSDSSHNQNLQELATVIYNVRLLNRNCNEKFTLNEWFFTKTKKDQGSLEVFKAATKFW